MLRIINFTRNVGASVLRSSVREDRHKSSSIPSPPNQFLFWFNEVPGCFTPTSLRSLSSPSIVPGKPCITFSSSGGVSHYQEFFEHRDQDSEHSLACLRAVRYSALLALSYSILHDKLLARHFQETWRSLSLDTILRLHCPVLSVKKKKTVRCQPLDASQPRGSNDLCCVKLDSYLDIKDFGEIPHSTSDYSSASYSSAKSDKVDNRSSELTPEELKLLKIQNTYLMNIEDVILSIQKVKNGKKDGVNELTVLSDQGNSLAQFYLGQIYENGIFGTKNLPKALKLYTMASNAGNAEAKFNLGLMLLRGNKDHEDTEGERLVQEAAEEGVMEAREMLGMGDVYSSFSLPEVILEDVDALYMRGQEMEDHELCDEEDKWIVLDSYKTAALAGNRGAAVKYNKLSSSLKR